MLHSHTPIMKKTRTGVLETVTKAKTCARITRAMERECSGVCQCPRPNQARSGPSTLECPSAGGCPTLPHRDGGGLSRNARQKFFYSFVHLPTQQVFIKGSCVPGTLLGWRCRCGPERRDLGPLGVVSWERLRVAGSRRSYKEQEVIRAALTFNFGVLGAERLPSTH